MCCLWRRCASAGTPAGSVFLCAIGRRSHDRLASARCRRSAALARDHARLPRRTPSRSKGRLYPVDPPTVEAIAAVMRKASDDRHGYRLRALIVVLWRGGPRVQEALALGERDLDPRRGSLLVRNGKGGRRREIGLDAWGWEQLRPWLAVRLELPVGPLFCVIDGPTRGRPWSSANVRVEFRRLAAHAGIRRRFAPHQLRHAHAVELAREGVPLNVIQRQLGHVSLGTTSIYLQGIDTEEIIATVHARRAPMMSASADSGSDVTDPTRSAGAHRRRSRWTLDPATASPNQASATKTRAGLTLAPGARPARAYPARLGRRSHLREAVAESRQ